MNNARILFVDDDANILEAYKRHFRKHFPIDTALGGEPALQAIAQGGPYAVVVADMRMPEMNGIQLLSRVKQIAPDTIRMMVTGNSDLATAVQAVNEGSIFRFFNKPCPPERLAESLEAGLRQYRLVTAERELLEKTLSGSIRVLTEMLSLIAPQSFDRATLLRNLAQLVAEELCVENRWELDVAVMLSPLGLVTVPPAVAVKERAGLTLSATEQSMLARVPEMGKNLLANIPRLEGVARIVFYQNKHFDGSGFPDDDTAQDSIPLASRILKAVSDLLRIQTRGVPRIKALDHMTQRQGWYDPRVLDAIRRCLLRTELEAPDRLKRSIPCSIKDLRVGQLLASDVLTQEGLLLLSAGHSLSGAAVARIRNIAEYSGIREPILIESIIGAK